MKARMWLITVFTISIITLLKAEPWKYTADVNLSFTQSSYSDNWAGSELSNVTWVGTANASAEKQFSPILLDKTTLKLAYGQTHLQKLNAAGDKYWATPEKSADKIDLESVLKFTLQTYVDPFLSGRWESQFLDLSDPAKPRSLNPNKFTETGGLSRTFIKSDHQNLNARLGFALRQSMDRDALNPVDLQRKTITTNDGGLDFVADYDKVFAPKDISYKSKLQVFQALYNSKKNELPNDYWKAADVTWEHTLSTKLWSVFTLSLYFELLYEKQQELSLQYKETLALGVSYQLF